MSNEEYYYHQLDKPVLEDVFGNLFPMVQDWIDNKIELVGKSSMVLEDTLEFR